MKWPSVRTSHISWREGETPASKKFSDIYYMPGQGPAEKTHVFLDGVVLDELVKKPILAIGETGFGTGLNFLLTLAKWKQKALAGAQLDYVAVEGLPLSRPDLERALSPYTDLAPLARELTTQWPPAVPGFHRIFFEGGRVRLTLLFGQAEEILHRLKGTFDAWYLDGFSPEKNPDMWSESIFREIARCSRPEARAATYTAAGFVRRHMEKAGFRVQKREGYGRKRESLKAVYKGRANKETPRGKSAVIVGAGIAGASMAFVLRRRGFDVTVIDRERTPARGTSGHPLAVVEPKLNRGYSAYADLMLSAFLFSRSLYESFKAENIWHPSRGSLHLATSREEADRLENLARLFPGFSEFLAFFDQEKIESLLPGTKTLGGLHFQDAGCVLPKLLCKALLGNVELRAADVQTCRETDGQWTLCGKDGAIIAKSPVVILANNLNCFAPFAPSPFRANRGQINYVPKSPDVALNISFPGGYLTPAAKSTYHVLGTSFEKWPDPGDQTWQSLKEKDFKESLNALSMALPRLAKGWENMPLRGRTGLRATTADHLPVAGPAFDYGRLKTEFEKNSETDGTGASLPGLYVLSGFGSRGFTTAPLAAEYLGSEICGTPSPCPDVIGRALSPARFHLKQLKRGKPL